MNRFLIIVLAFCVLSIQVYAQAIEQIISDNYKNKLKEKEEYYEKRVKAFHKKYKETGERNQLIRMDEKIENFCETVLEYIRDYRWNIKEQAKDREKIWQYQTYLANPNHPKFRGRRWDNERLQRELKKLSEYIAWNKKDILEKQKRIDDLRKDLLQVPHMLQEAEQIHARAQKLTEQSRSLPISSRFIPKRLVYWQSGSSGMKGNPKKLSAPLIQGTYKGILTETIKYKGETGKYGKSYIHEITYHFYTDPKSNLVYIKRGKNDQLDKRFGDKDKIYYSRISYDRWSRKVVRFHINSPNDWHFHRNVEPYFSDSRRHTKISNNGKNLYTQGSGSVHRRDKSNNREAVIDYRLELVKVADKPPIAFNNAIEIKLALIEEQKRKAKEYAEAHPHEGEAMFIGALALMTYGGYKAIKGVSGFIGDIFSQPSTNYRQYNNPNNYITKEDAQRLAQQIQTDVQKQLQLQGMSIEKIYDSLSPEEKKEAERLAREVMGR